MKNLILLAFMLSFSLGHSQRLNDYKYIRVPDSFSSFNENQYQLNYYLKLLLNKNDYTVLNEISASWPEEAKNNYCLVLNADVVKINKFLKNALELKFTDCNGKEVGTFEGVSKIKEYDKGYQEALRFAMNQAGAYKPSEMAALIGKNSIGNQKTKQPKNQPPSEVVVVAVDPPMDFRPDMGIEFKNRNRSVYLVEMKNNSFLMIDKSTSSMIGQLNPSSRAGVYQATVIGPKEKYTTTGFYDGNSLAIDFIENGKPKTEEFSKVN